jgi:hypothetical protein
MHGYSPWPCANDAQPDRRRYKARRTTHRSTPCAPRFVPEYYGATADLALGRALGRLQRHLTPGWPEGLISEPNPTTTGRRTTWSLPAPVRAMRSR